MPYYNYKAHSQDGKNINGLVEAPTPDAAAKLLRDKGFFVVTLEEAKEKVSLEQVTVRFQRVSFTDIVNFTRQLSTMIVAGLQLPEALGILRAQTTNQILSQVIMDIEHQITSGGNLADALSRYPQYFSDIYVALVRAGESSGTLDQILARLAETLETEQEFRAKVQGAMIYPSIIVIGMVVVVIIMMTVVVPKLTEMYRDFGVTLPWSTQLLMNMSDFTVKYIAFIIPALIGLFVLFQRWRKSVIGEFIVDSLILKIPLFGELQKKMILVEFTRTLGMLIGSGIHILDGLKILRGALGNVLYRNAVYEIGMKVEKGFSLGDSFAQHDIFPPIVSQMMKVGEETGKLDDTLTKLSKYFQSESEHLVKGLTTAIEPIIMVVLGVGVGFIVISIITPIYSLTNSFR
jgi:type IV pilus assembly protein PilC